MRAWLGTLLAVVALQAWAQDLPRPAMSREMRGRVVDDAGAPVAGAVVVVRWNWQRYASRFEGSGWSTEAEPIHIDEAVTDRDGRYAIRGWGPKVRAGRLDPDTPAVLVFKAGFEPARGRDADVKLHGAVADAGYARRVRAFQETSLLWPFAVNTWRSMPRMVDALYREKRRMGDDGAAILGPHMLPGRSGEGRLVDARTGKPVQQAVVAVAWTLRRSDGKPGTRRFVETKRAGTDRSEISFYVSPWRLPGPNVPGWEPDPAREPNVTIYAKGYRVGFAENWPEEGATIQLTPVAESREATLASLREWRRDIDRELAQVDRGAALEGARALLQDFAYQCRQFTPDVQKDLCFDPQSDVGQYVERSRAIASQPVETMEGTTQMRVVAIGAGQARAVAASPVSGYFQRQPVTGFSIEVAR